MTFINSTTQPQLILFQISQPINLHIDCLQNLRTDFPLASVVVVSPPQLGTRTDQYVRIGVNDHVLDPIDPTELDAVFTRWVAMESVSKTGDTVSTKKMGADKLDYFEGEEQALAKAHAKFLSYNAGIIETICSLYAKADWDQIQFVLHRFRGASLMFGYENLAQVLSKLQTLMAQRTPNQQIDAMMVELTNKAAAIDPRLVKASATNVAPTNTTNTKQGTVL
jgi:HPt (histidine-containing phosphotransfer) domain-containing protein